MPTIRLLSMSLLITTALSSVGCGGGGGEPQFRGKTLSEWVAQARGRDPATRLQAYDGLAGFPQDKVAIATLEQVVGSDASPTAERLAAARSLYRVTQDAVRVIAPIAAAIRKDADSAGGFVATKEAEDLLFWLGSKGRPLVPELQYALSRLGGRDAASALRRKQVQQIISDIPKE